MMTMLIMIVIMTITGITTIIIMKNLMRLIQMGIYG
jgi:hypothetical protein